MSIFDTRLPHTAKLIQKSITFSAGFNLNVLYPGKYDFGYSTTNQNVLVLESKPNTVYYIDRASVSGVISSEDFFRSIFITPKVFFSRILGNEYIYSEPVPISGYFQEQPYTAFFSSDKKGDGIRATLTGVLDQLSSTIGINPIKIYLNLSIYAIDENSFNSSFRSMI